MIESQQNEKSQRKQTIQRLEKLITEKDAMIAQGTKNLMLLTDASVIASVQNMIQEVQKERKEPAQALEYEFALLAQGEEDELAWKATVNLLRQEWSTLVAEGRFNVADPETAQDLRALFSLLFDKVVVTGDMLELSVRFPVIEITKEDERSKNNNRFRKVGAGRGS